MRLVGTYLIALSLLFLCGCSISADIFGQKELASIDPGPVSNPDMMTGHFPLGKGKFLYNPTNNNRYFAGPQRIFSVQESSPFEPDGMISVFNTNGDFLFRVLREGTGDGEAQYVPHGSAIVFDSSGNFYILDSVGQRIQKFSSTGTFLMKWGTMGSGAGQFNSPYSIAIDSNNVIYVADLGNNRIQRFTTSGVYIDAFGTNGTGNGQFSAPSSVIIDHNDFIYVADNGTRIQKFAPNLSYVTSWTTSFTMPSEPLATVDGANNLYLINPFSSPPEIHKYDSSGVDLGVIIYGSSQNLWTPATIFSEGSTLYISDFGYGIKSFTTSGTFNGAIFSSGTIAGQFSSPFGVAVNPNTQDIYVVDTFNFRIQRFDGHGDFLGQWGSQGAGNGQFLTMGAIAIDSNGNVYISDVMGNRIQKFTSSGVYLSQWGTTGTGNGEFQYPYGMAIDSDNNVYVVDAGNSRIQKFNSNGTYLTQWGSMGTGDGQFALPMAIAIDKNKNIYVVDNGSRNIQKFSAIGSFVTKWGSIGSGNGEFNNPTSIAVDSQGKVYVLDAARVNIQIFDGSGAYLSQWGSKGISMSGAMFLSPNALTIDSFDRVLVSDTYSNLLKRFTVNGTVSP